MTDDSTATYESSSNEFRRILDEYGRALAAKAPNVVALFDESRDAWQRMCALAPADSPEANVDPEEMHLVLTFSNAVASAHAEEAERIYRLMSPAMRQVTDAIDLDTQMPRWQKMKIWER